MSLMRQQLSARQYSSLGVAHFVLVLVVWASLTYSGLVSPMFLPTPDKVMATGWQLLSDGTLLENTLISTYRVATGFIVSAIFAIPLGMLMGTLKMAEGFFEPMFGFIRYLPASAFIPLFILWLGLGETEKIMVIFFGTFFQQTLMFMNVTKDISQDLIEVSYTLGAKGIKVFTRVILPAILPGIVDTLRITFGWAWTYLVVAEIVGANSGLGYAIMMAARYGHIGKIFVFILTIGLLGLITDLLFKWLYKVLFPWQRGGVA